MRGRSIAVALSAVAIAFAGAPGGDTYAEALRELFGLDPQAVDAVAAGEIALPAMESDTGLPDSAE